MENSMSAKSMQPVLMAILFSVTAAAWTAPVPKKQEGWKTYRSPDFGFTIAYPETMTFYPGHPDEPPEGAMFPICDDTTVACFQYNGNALEGTPAHAAGVSVNVLREFKTATECGSSIDQSLNSTRTTRIHGMLFHYGDTGEAGLGSGRSITEYVAFHQHVCFEVALVTAGRNVAAQEMKDEGLHPVSRRAWRTLRNDMETMLHSFAFVGPVKDGPDWSVLRDWGCGSIFEYPSTTVLHRVREYTNAVFYSNRIACEQSFAYQGREYNVAAKMNLIDANALDEWLTSSGYPGLEQMKIVAKDDEYTEYSDGTYTLFFLGGKVFIFTVSDESHHPIPSQGDLVFAHLICSFRVR